MKKEQEKQIGLWLDHAKAHFIDVSAESPVIQTAYSSLTLMKGKLVNMDQESDSATIGQPTMSTKITTVKKTLIANSTKYF